MTERTDCWRCGESRPIYESCLNCGGSCKPRTQRKQHRAILRRVVERAERNAARAERYGRSA